MATPFGKYALLRKLAEGGMAELFLARQVGMEGFEKLLVVKRILPSLCTDESFVSMFLNEARVAARLNHPNVVQLYDLGKVGEQYFIAMELVHGEDLRAVQEQLGPTQKKVPLGLACRVLADTLAGLHYAHTRVAPDGKPLGLVHRDISPANVLVTYEGTVKVCDFGIAKATAATSEQTQTGLVKGKFAYMSPEQSKGQPVDARSDVFSCGILLWETLLSQRLFRRDSDMAMLRAVGGEPIRPPRQIRPDVPEALDRIVMRALERPLDRRYATAQEMRADLETLIRDQRWEADALAMQRWMRELFAAKLKAQADDIRAAGQASLDDFLLTVEEHTNISWMTTRRDDRKNGSRRSAAMPVASMYDEEQPTVELTDRPKALPPRTPSHPSLSAMPDVIPTVVLSSDVQPVPAPTTPSDLVTAQSPTLGEPSVVGVPALASTAPMGVQSVQTTTAKQPSYDPPSRWRRLAVIASAAIVAGGGALTVVLWPEKPPTVAPTVLAPPVVTVPDPPRHPAPPPPAPSRPSAPAKTTATLAVTTDMPAHITVDGAAQPFGRSATVEVRAGEPHVVTAQRPGHSVRRVNVPAPDAGARVPVAVKLK